MTKAVRIENADNAVYKLKVEVWDKGYPEGTPDVLVCEKTLDHPTFMTEICIHSTRYLIVREYQ